jgi:hypothetical protein
MAKFSVKTADIDGAESHMPVDRDWVASLCVELAREHL